MNTLVCSVLNTFRSVQNTIRLVQNTVHSVQNTIRLVQNTVCSVLNTFRSVQNTIHSVPCKIFNIADDSLCRHISNAQAINFFNPKKIQAATTSYLDWYFILRGVFAIYITGSTAEGWFSGRNERTVLPACHISESRSSANSTSNFSR